MTAVVPAQPAVSRAPRPRGTRVRLLAVLLTCLAGIGVLAATGLRDSVTYYRTPTEVLNHPPTAGDRFRLGGLVVSGSLHRDGDTIRFTVTDGVSQVPVVHRGDTPQMLREGAGAVVEGQLRGGTFDSDLVMVRHSNEYRPPAPGQKPAP